MGFPATPTLASTSILSPRLGVESVKHAKNGIFHFQIIKPCCKNVANNNIQRQLCTTKCLEGNFENIFEIDLLLLFSYSNFGAPLAMALCSKRCISETAALICMCHTLLGRLLNAQIGGTFRGTISIQRTRPTAIAGHLVL